MERLNYNVLPLKDMVIRRLVAVIFKGRDILSSVKDFRPKYVFWSDDDIKVWKETVEDKMSDKISKLGLLPKSLTKLLIDTVKPMGRQIPEWKRFHEEHLLDSLRKGTHFDAAILEKLRWSASGVIDYQKTAEELIRSDMIDIVKRYQLACLYCLKDCTPLLWEELPTDSKLYFYSGIYKNPSAIEKLQFWWPHIIRGEHSELATFVPGTCLGTGHLGSWRRNRFTFHQFAFQFSVGIRNKAAAEYFFQKLTQEEKDSSLITVTDRLLLDREFFKDRFPIEKASEMLRYLLSVMTSDQQMLIFQKHNHRVFECFLLWPLQDQFSQFADLIWDIFPEIYYNAMLRKMYAYFKNSGYYFQKLFLEFFHHFRIDFRKSFVDRQCQPASLFSDVLRLQDEEALAAIFRSVDDVTRDGLVFSEVFLKYLRSSILGGQWNALAVCLREARLSEEDKNRLKEMNIQTQEWTRFFQLLDETDVTGKRCSEDESPIEAKVQKTENSVRNDSKIN